MIVDGKTITIPAGTAGNILTSSGTIDTSTDSGTALSSVCLGKALDGSNDSGNQYMRYTGGEVTDLSSTSILVGVNSTMEWTSITDISNTIFKRSPSGGTAFTPNATDITIMLMNSTYTNYAQGETSLGTGSNGKTYYVYRYVTTISSWPTDTAIYVPGTEITTIVKQDLHMNTTVPWIFVINGVSGTARDGYSASTQTINGGFHYVPVAASSTLHGLYFNIEYANDASHGGILGDLDAWCIYIR